MTVEIAVGYSSCSVLVSSNDFSDTNYNVGYNHEVPHPIVFYEITNVECVYSSNITIFIGRI